MPDFVVGRLAETFKGADIAEHGRKWDSLWKDSYTPWDRGEPSMALADVLAEQPDLFGGGLPSPGHRKTALVPGCGRGYDVRLLSAFGYDAYGLDFSEGAIKEAQEVQKKGADDEVYRPRKGVEEAGKITWLTGDFFKDDFLKEAGVEEFDLIFDYTFFCALPLSARPAWARRMSELLKPDGRLICLEFPSTKPPSTGGPPFGVTPGAYVAHLSHPGEEVPYDEDGGVDVDKLGRRSGYALERIAHLTPARTHRAGYAEDGTVDDRVSVWKHYVARPASLRYGR